MRAGQPIFGLMAEFDHPHELLHAVERVVEEGYTEVEAYSPFPVEGVAEALGFRTKLPLIVLIAGIIGCVGGFYMQLWMMGIDYPLNIGGKPLNSWPMWIPVTFELTILFAGLTAAIAMLGLNGLPRPYHPVFNVPRFELASDDRFFITIEFEDPKFDELQTRQFLETLNPKGIYLVDV